jgi:hypothetical protein
MKAHIDYQTIDYDGKHAFVLVPWEQFRRVQPLLEGDKAPPPAFRKRLSKRTCCAMSP